VPARADDISQRHRACHSGDANACNSLGIAYTEGEVVKENLSLAAAYFQRACDQKDGDGCYRISQAYLDGVGVKLDFFKATLLMLLACRYGHEDACAIHNASIEAFESPSAFKPQWVKPCPGECSALDRLQRGE
jgi:hypothetical protein